MDPSGQHSSGAAQRRKQRRMRSWWQHEQVSVAAAVATALHHCSQRGGGVARLPTGTEDSGNREEEVHEMYGALRRQNRPPPKRRPEPLEEVSEPQAGIGRHMGVGYELVRNPVVPQMAEQLVEVSLLALAVKYISPAPAVSQASSPVVEYVAPVPAVLHAPTPVVETIAPAPAVFQATTPAVEYSAPLPVVFQAPTPAVEYITPVPAVVLSPSSCGGVCCTRASLVRRAGVRCGVLSRWLAPGVDHFSPAPAVSHAARGRSLQGSVSGQSSTSRRRHALPLPSGWRRVEDAYGRVYYWHVHTRQTRFTPPASDDEDEDEEDEEDEEDDEEEDEDLDGAG